jgi:hypothetical protein
MMERREGRTPSAGWVDGIRVAIDHPETPHEKAERLGRLAYHTRMRKIFSWLDGRPVRFDVNFAGMNRD